MEREAPRLGGRVLIEALGALSVVLSLAFVALQIKQSTDQARAEVAYDLQESFNGFHDLVAGDAELGSIVARARVGTDPALTPAEHARAFSLAFRLFNTWVAVQVAYDNDLISDAAFEGYQADVASAVSGLPGFRGYWLSMIEANPTLAGAAILAPLA